MSWSSDTLGRDRRSAGCQALNSKRLKLGAKAYGSRRAIVQTTWQDVAGMFKSFNTTICCRHVQLSHMVPHAPMKFGFWSRSKPWSTRGGPDCAPNSWHSQQRPLLLVASAHWRIPFGVTQRKRNVHKKTRQNKTNNKQLNRPGAIVTLGYIQT